MDNIAPQSSGGNAPTDGSYHVGGRYIADVSLADRARQLAETSRADKRTSLLRYVATLLGHVEGLGAEQSDAVIHAIGVEFDLDRAAVDAILAAPAPAATAAAAPARAATPLRRAA